MSQLITHKLMQTLTVSHIFFYVKTPLRVENYNDK